MIAETIMKLSNSATHTTICPRDLPCRCRKTEIAGRCLRTKSWNYLNLWLRK